MNSDRDIGQVLIESSGFDLSLEDKEFIAQARAHNPDNWFLIVLALHSAKLLERQGVIQGEHDKNLVLWTRWLAIATIVFAAIATITLVGTALRLW